MALLLLADRSVFLDPPANELPATPTPDAATQQHLLEAAKRFAVETFQFTQPARYANHLQLRRQSTGSDEGRISPANRAAIDWLIQGRGFRSEREGESIDTHRGRIITRAGRTHDLGRIRIDTPDHSERFQSREDDVEPLGTDSSGVVAVFHYEVPKTASHYEIDTPVEQIQHNTGSNRWARGGGAVATITTAMVRSKLGYQGSLWIDPASGTILRVTLVADLKGNSTIERGAILVDYGPVPIADRTVICPVRSWRFFCAGHGQRNFKGRCD